MNLSLDNHKCSKCESLIPYHKEMAFRAKADLFEFDMVKKIPLENKIDDKIVAEAKQYFCRGKPFNPTFIFYQSFEISYKKFADDQLKKSIKNVCSFFFIIGKFNEIDSTARIPKEIILKILLPLSIPSSKEFQCHIFEKMDKKDAEIIKEIKENILPKERDPNLGDIASRKMQDSSCLVQ